MEKDMKSKKYYIVVNRWDESKKEYITRVVSQTHNKDKAFKLFGQMQTSSDEPLIEIYEETEDSYERIAYKDNYKG